MGFTENTAGYAWAKDADGIVTVTMDDPDSAVNTMNPHFVAALEATVDRLEAERDTIAGVILASAKKSWFAGGDLNRLRAAEPAHAAEETAHITHVKSLLRRLEKLGRPVVAVMNGTALGGGLEVALACHHRIAASDARGARFGLPEVSLGLLPGGGGITRTVRMLGLQKALQEVILPATRFPAEHALAVGIVDEVAPAAELDARARAWITANPAPVKPWDQKGFRLPGGTPSSPALAQALPALPALLRAQLRGAPLPAPRAALAAAVEGSYVDFDTASLIETRYFVSLTHTQVAKNMIKAFFFDRQQIDSGASRPDGIPRSTARKVGVIGAGRRGAAIAYAAAQAGVEVVLTDTSRDAAENAKDYARSREENAIAHGATTAQRSEALLARITTTSDTADFAGVDVVVDVVVDVDADADADVDADADADVDVEPVRREQQAEGVALPAEVVGIHFFSPLQKTPLVEIVRGRDTSDEALAKTFDFVRQIGMTPIVVKDSPGFFTARVIGTFIGEAVAAVGEGVEPASVEQAALQAGHPTGALQLADELALTPSRPHPHPSEAVMDWMVEDAGRPGRAAGAGFYDYDADGRRVGIWPGLREKYGSGRTVLPLQDLQERMLFAEALAAIDLLDSGVVASVADANIGSLYGIGFPVWTGGVLQYVNQYPGGLSGFVARARDLADTYGERFTPPASLISRAAAGETYQ